MVSGSLYGSGHTVKLPFFGGPYKGGGGGGGGGLVHVVIIIQHHLFPYILATPIPHQAASFLSSIIL